MNAALTKNRSVLVRLLNALARVRFSLSFVAPEGYQDESGFHYGVPPRAKAISWPPAD